MFFTLLQLAILWMAATLDGIVEGSEAVAALGRTIAPAEIHAPFDI
jgi:hypothetical protein